jgi:hypothetical protein
VLAGLVEIKVHLAGVRVREFAEFQINNHQAPQAAMKKKQVDAEPLISDE